MEVEITVDVSVKHNYSDMLERVRRIQKEADFSQEVLVGIQAIQTAQRTAAPVRKDSRIPASIKPARISRTGNTWRGVSRTTYGPAVFTNEGTGEHGPTGSKYKITQNRIYKKGPNAGKPYTVDIMHPGIRGTHWWEAGAEIGSKIALEAFRRKVSRMLRR